MKKDKSYEDQRSSTRTKRSDAMFWLGPDDDTPQMGWLLESSETGFAFAWRGDTPPAIDETIRVHANPAALRDAPREAIVKRAHTAHEDLVIVAGAWAEHADAPTETSVPVVTREVWSFLEKEAGTAA